MNLKRFLNINCFYHIYLSIFLVQLFLFLLKYFFSARSKRNVRSKIMANRTDSLFRCLRMFSGQAFLYQQGRTKCFRGKDIYGLIIRLYLALVSQRKPRRRRWPCFYSKPLQRFYNSSPFSKPIKRPEARIGTKGLEQTQFDVRNIQKLN